VRNFKTLIIFQIILDWSNERGVDEQDMKYAQGKRQETHMGD
jgi:hypothetical protein